MANILRLFDDYSGEDYLCHKLKPSAGGDYVCALCGDNCYALIHNNHCETCDKMRDIPEYICSHCGCNVEAEDINRMFCGKCGAFLYVTEK